MDAVLLMVRRGTDLQSARRTFAQLSLLGLRKVITLVAAVSLAVLLALFFYEPQRSFLVEAETRSVELTFLPGANTWRFPRAVLCTPVPAPLAAPDPDCGLVAQADRARGEVIAVWQAGTEIALQSRPGGGLRIEVKNANQPGFAEGSTIRILPQDMAATGALTFAASAALGQDLSAGTQSYLLSGRWEARETGLVISAFRSLTEVVKAGALTRGTRVEVLDAGAPAQSYGHVAADAEGILHVSVLSAAGDTALSVRHFGLDRPVVLEPDWMDLTLSSPLILALGVLLAMLAAISQIISDAPALGRGRKKDGTGG